MMSLRRAVVATTCFLVAVAFDDVRSISKFLERRGNSTYEVRLNETVGIEASNVSQGANSSNSILVEPFGFIQGRGGRAILRGAGGKNDNCFPGMAEVIVRSNDEQRPVSLPIAQLRVGQEVLVEADDRTPTFEPVLGFLHFAPGVSGRYHVLVHSRGQLRATAEHIVFTLNAQGQRVDMPMKDVRIGDQVLTASQPGSALLPSSVLAVREDMAASEGMFAPLTASGSIVVDKTVASVYAGAAAYRSGPHAAYHALFFVARIWYQASGWLASGQAAEAPFELHPAAQFFEATLGPLFRISVAK